jgi:hypothetical protein
MQKAGCRHVYESACVLPPFNLSTLTPGLSSFISATVMLRFFMMSFNDSPLRTGYTLGVCVGRGGGGQGRGFQGVMVLQRVRQRGPAQGRGEEHPHDVVLGCQGMRSRYEVKV